MIKAQICSQGTNWQEGGTELIDQWLHDPSALLWLDVEGETPQNERLILEQMDCHPLAIEDVQRFRNPPKTEIYDNYTMMLYRGISTFNDDLTIEQQTIALFAGVRCLVSTHKLPSRAINHYWPVAHAEELLSSPGLLATRIMRFSVGRHLDMLLGFEPVLTELEDSMQDKPNDALMREMV